MASRWSWRANGLSDLHDVVVVGGGPAGLATAITTARAGLKTLVLERSCYQGERRVGEHLAPRGVGLLRQLGFPPGEFGRVSPGVASAWSSSELHYQDYMMSPFGQGLNLARPAFDRAFAERARSLGVEFRLGCTVREPAWNAEWHLEGVRGRWLVDASGRSSTLLSDFTSTDYGDQLVGVSAYAQVEGSGPGRLHIEAMEDGWWYLAPLAQGWNVGVWMTDGDLLRVGGVTPLERWQERLQGSVLAKKFFPVPPQEVHVNPARTRRLDRFVGEHWLAVGDAAMSFDPLSSQGIAKGLRFGVQAGDAVAQALLGRVGALEAYAKGLEQEFAQYLKLRLEYYREVQSWSQSPFWSRRQSGSPVLN